MNNKTSTPGDALVVHVIVPADPVGGPLGPGMLGAGYTAIQGGHRSTMAVRPVCCITHTQATLIAAAEALEALPDKPCIITAVNEAAIGLLAGSLRPKTGTIKYLLDSVRRAEEDRENPVRYVAYRAKVLDRVA